MTARLGRWARAVLVALCGLLLLVGCVRVPTTGQVERIEGGQPQCQDCVTIDVDPPPSGAEPLQIVQGFLRANASYQPNYGTAREYLTEAAAGRWSPEAGVAVYTGGPVLRGDGTVTFEGRLVGGLDADRTYTQQNRRLTVNFGLVQEDGEWRISRPPAGLMVPDYSFASFYRPYDLFFVGSGRSLVPDRIYLPDLPGRAGVASVLIKELLAGPSAWLRPAVTSAVPLNTTLSVDSVTITSGVAEIPLAGDLSSLDDAQRTLLAAQTMLTLREATGVTGVRFTTNGQPLPIPGSDLDTQTFSTIPLGLEPVPWVAAEQLFAIRGRSVLQTDASGTVPELVRLPGALGDGRLDPDDLTVTLAGTDLGLVTDRRTALRRVSVNGGSVETLLTGAANLLRPQFSRYDELWTLGETGGRQRFFVYTGKRAVPVEAPWVAGGRVTAFRLSPDGTRMAAVREVGGRSELGLLRITRADRITVDGWRTVVPRGSSLARIADVSWINAVDMVALAASSADQPLTAYQVSEDGYGASVIGEPGNWDARSVTVLLRTGAPVVLARNGQAFRNEGSQWAPYLDRVDAVSYPG